MSLEGIESIWSSPANRPGPDDVERLRHLLVERLGRDRRRLTRTLALAALPLAAASGLLVARLVGATGEPAGGGWALAPMLALSWLALWRFARARRAHLAAHGRPADSIRVALAAAADANRRARSRVRWVVGLELAAVPALALALRGLLSEGRVRPDELPSLAGVLALLLLGSALGAVAWDRLRLRPEQRHLSELLEAYR
jgi:hypothetical protein